MDIEVSTSNVIVYKLSRTNVETNRYHIGTYSEGEEVSYRGEEVTFQGEDVVL